jgi:hypothetical protein
MQKRDIVRGRLSRLLSRSGAERSSESGPLMERCEPRMLLDAVVWDGGAGTNNWNDAANWNRNGVDAVPMNGDDVTINVAANPNVMFTSGSVTLNSLMTNEALTVTGGTLGLTGAADVNAALTMMGGTLSGGSWDVTGGSLHGSSNGGFLTNTQITGDILLDATSATVRVTGSTRFTAARLSANASGLQFAPGYTLFDLIVVEGGATGGRSITGAVGGTGALTIAPSGVIRLAAGSGGNLSIVNSSAMTLVNNGLITAEAAGRTISFNNTTVTNNATIQATAGTLDVSPTNLTNSGAISVSDAALTVAGVWSNTGTITATDSTLTLGGTWPVSGSVTATNSTVNLGGTFTGVGLAGFARTGGTVNLTGTMDNTGNTFNLNAATGSWNLSGGSVVGGTLNFSAGSRLAPSSSGGTLQDVQVNGELIADTTSATVRITGSTRFTAVRLAANAANVQFATGYTLMDLVVAEGAPAGGRSIVGAVGGTGVLTIAPSGVIRLAANSGGNLSISNSSAMTLVNNGLISAEAAGRTLSFNNTTVTNNGTIQVSDGAIDLSPTNWTNAGAITATGGVLSLAGMWSSAGTITETNATVNLGGSFSSNAFSIARTGGTINVTGSMDNTGNTITLNAATGSWNLSGGTITGGTLAFTGGNRLAITSGSGTLQDVQVNGELLADTTSASVRIAGSTRFTALRLAANAANVQITTGYTLMDLIVAEGAAVGGRSIVGAVGGTGTLTVGPTGVIRLAAGAGGNLTISNSSALTLINNGLISAEATGRTLSVNNTTFTNNAAAQVSAGILDLSPTNWTNAGTITATDATLSLGGTWSNSGTITEANSTVNLGGSFGAAGLAIARTGGTINVTGTMDNTGATFTFNSTTGPWTLHGGTITGGTLVFNADNRLQMTSSGGILQDVRVTGELLLDTTSASVRVAGSTRFTAARLSANAASMQFAPGYTLMDLVVAEGAAVGGRSVLGAVGGTGTLTVGPTGVIRLGAGAGGNLTISNSSALTLINNGLITAEATGRTLAFNNTAVTNNATIQVTAGTLDLSPTNWTNAGTLAATDGTLSVGGMWSSTGTITETNATVNLGGSFVASGLAVARSGGTINVTGMMDNTGNTLTFNATTGPWALHGGTITGGTLVFNADNRLQTTSSGGTLQDVQVNGDLLLDTTSATVRAAGTTRFAAARLSANAASIQFVAGYTLMDLVVAEGPAVGSRSVLGAVGGSGTLTVGPTGVIRLAAGSGGNLSIANSSLATLVNNGLISAEAAGRTLTINTTDFTNNGTAQALAGILNISPTNFTNYDMGVLSGGAFNAFGAGMVTLPAMTTIVTNNATIGVGNVGNFPAVLTLATNNGTLQTGGGGMFTITPDGGTLVNNGTVILAPTNVLRIAGDYTQAPTATMVAQIQGSGASDIGQITITGTATLAGNATVTAVNGYQPGCVNSIFLTAGQRNGEFDTRTLPTPPPDHQTFLVYACNQVRFAISPPSDFNRDGVLNSQDFFDFIAVFFQNSMQADFNHDNVVNSQDFFDFIADFFEGCG